MSSTTSLTRLEGLLEGFLGHVVSLKEQRLQILEGIDSLDEITRISSSEADVSDRMGEWFASHNRWLTDNCLKEADFVKISEMFSELKGTIQTKVQTPADRKINSEIDRWTTEAEKKTGSKKIVLKRPPEKSVFESNSSDDSISLFVKRLSKITAMFMDFSQEKHHILSVLDSSLNSALTQVNKDALILSAFIIYYLKQNGYKVEPYVKKLKEAETLFNKRTLHA